MAAARYPLLLLLLTVTSCLSTKLDEETKAFIRLVIENCDKEASCLCNGPVCAVPRGDRVRVAPCQVSYSSNSDLSTQYLIAEMLYIK